MIRSKEIWQTSQELNAELLILDPRAIILHEEGKQKTHGHFRFGYLVFAVPILSECSDDGIKFGAAVLQYARTLAREADDFSVFLLTCESVLQPKAGANLTQPLGTMRCYDPAFVEQLQKKLPHVNLLDASGLSVVQCNSRDFSELRGSVDYPLSLISAQPSDFKVFAPFQTKFDLEPTLEFWQPIQLYTTFSGYPWIREFLTQVFERIELPEEASALIAPCGSGDFIRFLPPSIGDRLSSIVGCDIRRDFLDLAQTRIGMPELDLLNLFLCHQFSRLLENDDERIAKSLALFFSGFNKLPYFPAFVATLARLLDQVLSHNAIPDWYLPLKFVLAAQGVQRPVLAANVATLPSGVRTALLKKINALKEVVPEWAEVEAQYSSPDVATRLKLIPADLLQDDSIPAGPFDIVLSWEFIHVARKPGQLKKFLSSIIRRLQPGGVIVLTSIREGSTRYPDEHTNAKGILEQHGLRVREELLRPHSTDCLPFERRLESHYPLLIAKNE